MGTPFAGWHVHSEEPDQLIVLAADPRVRESTEALAAVGFARVELASTQLTAIWPDFPWETEDDQGEGDVDSFPSRVRRAAGSLSDLAMAAESALRSTGRPLRSSRARLTLTGLLAAPLLLGVAGFVALSFLYDAYPTVRDGQLLGVMACAGIVLSALYTAIAYRLSPAEGEHPTCRAYAGGRPRVAHRIRSGKRESNSLVERYRTARTGGAGDGGGREGRAGIRARLGQGVAIAEADRGSVSDRGMGYDASGYRSVLA